MKRHFKKTNKRTWAEDDEAEGLDKNQYENSGENGEPV